MIVSPNNNEWALGRKYHHKQGRDIKVVYYDYQKEQLLRSGASDYFIEFVPISREFRLLMVKQRLAYGYEKTLHDETYATSIARNNRFGWVFNPLNDEGLKDRLIPIAQKTMTLLKADFGAIDMCLTQDNTIKVFELNAAPGFSSVHSTGARRFMKRILTDLCGVSL